MMKYILIGLAIMPSLFLFGQKHDNLWILGYSHGLGGSEEDSLGLSILDFSSENSLHISSNYQWTLGFDVASTNFSDAKGNYLFSSNGVRIYDREGEWLEGGENLNENENNGYILPQGVLALPHPRDSNLYAFFHGRKGSTPRMEETWYSEIDMRKNKGLGAVTSMQPLIQDTLLYGQITAVKHGNGRDWWIIFQRNCDAFTRCKNNFFYKVLLNSEGIQVFEQKIQDDLKTNTGLGQAVFTPDGTKYIAVQGDRFEEPSYIDIYDFDRCTGEFSNRIRIETVITDRGDGENGGTGGIAVSPNSRFLYFNTWKKIFQYDLSKENAQIMQDSSVVVAEYDGFVQYTQSGFPLGTRFLRGQLAPDGKIYICTTNSTQYLHVIHSPNEKELACNVEQHGIYLPTFNGFSIPNHPNYRLGAWEGSVCDTLNDPSVSTADLFTKTEVKLYPNPASDLLNITINTKRNYQTISVRLYDLLGNLVRDYHNTTAISLQNYPAGIYLAQIALDGAIIQTQKLIIQR
ncbi:MAG: T9SS type A sorting domain-containing protein [Bacteroidota bacterium]